MVPVHPSALLDRLPSDHPSCGVTAVGYYPWGRHPFHPYDDSLGHPLVLPCPFRRVPQGP